MLPELFQDDEKTISPTSATSSGRTPLTRLSAKPTKGRPGQTAKEHKKTVGHQVSSGFPSGSAEASGLPFSASQVGSSGEERLQLSLSIPPPCTPPTHPTPSPHPASDLWLWLSLSQNSLLYIFILLPPRTLLTCFIYSLGVSCLGLCRASAPSAGTVPSPFLDVLCSVGSVAYMLSAWPVACGFGQEAEH